MIRPEFLLLDVDGVLQFADETSEDRLNQSYNWITSHDKFMTELFSNEEFQSTQTGEADFLIVADKILPNHVHDLGAAEYMSTWLNGNINLNQELIDRIPEFPVTYLATNQDRHRGKYIESIYAPHVAGSFISYKMGVSKPSPEYFSHILEILDTEPEKCIFVDDREANVSTAQSFGINGIVFQDNESLFAEFEVLGLL